MEIFIVTYTACGAAAAGRRFLNNFTACSLQQIVTTPTNFEWPPGWFQSQGDFKVGIVRNRDNGSEMRSHSFDANRINIQQPPTQTPRCTALRACPPSPAAAWEYPCLHCCFSVILCQPVPSMSATCTPQICVATLPLLSHTIFFVCAAAHQQNIPKEYAGKIYNY